MGTRIGLPDKVILLLFIHLVTPCPIRTLAQENAQSSLGVSSEGRRWVDQTLKQMSLEKKVGQMLQVRVYGDYAGVEDPHFRFVLDQIQKYHIGSLDLGARMAGPNLVKGNPLQVAKILNELQRNSKVPLLIGSDIERGLASRLSDVPDFPFPMAFGAIGDDKLVEQFAAITAKEARSVGIKWAYAPVADVNSNPKNPIINTRSFGEDPGEVARLVAAYVRGAHRGGMLVSAKHFPGQGDSTTDSHIGVVQVLGDRAHLQKYEFPPFESAIKAGVDSVMPSHASAPALDSAPRSIATISPKIVTGVLRDELGFQGVVLTDALEMRSVLSLYPPDSNPSARVAVDAVKAGDDVLMLPRDVGAAFQAIVDAVRSGEIAASRIDRSVRRILEMKASAGLNRERFVDLKQTESVFADKSANRLAQDISDRAVTLLRDNGKVLPITPLDSTQGEASSHDRLAVLIWTDSAYSHLGHEFEREMRVRRPDAIFFRYYNDRIDSDDPEAIESALGAADRIVAAIFETSIPGRQVVSQGRVVNTVGLHAENMALLAKILRIAPKKTVVVALGSPYLIAEQDEIQNYICTYSLALTAEVSAVKAIFGEISNQARLPTSVSPELPRGFSKPWRKSDAVLR
jgi:beta-N-acetylhexosaminidase